MSQMWEEKRRFIIWSHRLVTIGLVKVDIAEDDIPLLVRALEHYAAYLEATKRPDDRYVALAEELKRKQPQAESAKPEKSAKRRT